MDILIGVILPISLAVIMLSLGIGLTFADFLRVFSRGKAFLIGAICQVLLVPLSTFAVITAFGITGELATGFMLLSFCPGGVTTNIISKLAKGDVALSVSLTTTISLLSILTVPVAIAWAVMHFMGDTAPDVSVTSLGIAMFAITAVPVAIGVTIRHFSASIADRMEPILSKLATALFVIIVIAAVAGNWNFFVENLGQLGPALIIINVILMLLGLTVAMLVKLSVQEQKTISIETGIQNSTLAITMAPIIMGVSDGFTVLSLPAAIYGVTMYLVALPFVIWFRSR